MEQTFTLPQKTRQLLVILIPILITQVTMFAMHFFDTIMSGQASAQDLAGVAIGSSIWVPINAGLGGILAAITPIVAQLIGARRKELVAFKVVQGIYLAIVISGVVISVGVFVLDPILSLMSLEPDVAHIARYYLAALAFGIPPLFILRGYKDVNVTFIMALISYWVIGLPLGYYLGTYTVMGAFGYWIGLISGLAVNAFGLFVRLRAVERLARSRTL